MLLLLELLDHSVVKMHRESVETWRGLVEISLRGYAAPQASHHPQAENERRHSDHENDDRTEDDRIGQQSYHSPPYQRRNWLPAKSASKAMLPRKTPNGIW